MTQNSRIETGGKIRVKSRKVKASNLQVTWTEQSQQLAHDSPKVDPT